MHAHDLLRDPLRAGAERTLSGVPDIVGPGLDVLFCGINPGTRSGQLGQHFARPGNRFWKVLHGAGFTDRLLTPDEQWSLLDYRLGVTNIVTRTSRAASDLTPAELRSGAVELEVRVAEWSPRFLAVLGVQAYRTAFARPKAVIGRQEHVIGSGTGVWVLPNPSGLQAHYQLADMVRLYGDLRAEVGG
ncbi:MAG TPA: G/U mismatch-specific DNA glycosylase [Acidimicrobiales bacterium]|nr:G/U mismatch-specific DNA glycosylase [Acidimicrobiales bacterium]